MTQLELNLYENALDSIAHAIEHYVADQKKPNSYKYTILHLSQGVALLLKERLSREHPNFIYVDVSKPEGNTVNIEDSIKRLEKIAKIDLGNGKKTIRDLANYRNNFEHFAVSLPKQEADDIIGRSIIFIASFVKNELNHDFQSEIGEENWKELIKIQEYRRASIVAAKVKIQDENQIGLYCNNCEDETAIKTYDRRPEVTFHTFTIECLACLQQISQGILCRGCGAEIPLSAGEIRQHNSYCSECRRKAEHEFKGLDFPTYGLEIERWFQSNETITYEQLLNHVGNVATLVSGAPRLPGQLFKLGAIDFADDFYRERHESLKGKSFNELVTLGLWNYGSGLQKDDRFVWVWKPSDD